MSDAQTLYLAPVAQARIALDAAKRELADLDARIAACREELDQREVAQMAHRTATINAVSAGKPVPKPPKMKASDAEVAMPILQRQREAYVERIADCEGGLRGTLVREVERRYRDVAQAEFAAACALMIEKWSRLLGMKALLDQTGAGKFVDPLPEALYTSFFIPALGKMRPICNNHVAHFVAEHAIDQGALTRAMRAARDEVERELGEKLPW